MSDQRRDITKKMKTKATPKGPPSQTSVTKVAEGEEAATHMITHPMMQEVEGFNTETEACGF